MESSKEVTVERNADTFLCVQLSVCVLAAGRDVRPVQLSQKSNWWADCDGHWNMLKSTAMHLRKHYPESVCAKRTQMSHNKPLLRSPCQISGKKKITFMSASLLPMVTEGGRSTCCSDAECAVLTTEVQLFLTWCWVSMVTRGSARQWCVCQE